MAISEVRKEKLRQLELERGGVAFATKRSSATPTPTLVISLGGLGAMTLNKLKGKFAREIGHSDHIYFRMIDTDGTTFRDYLKVTKEGKPSSNPNANMEMGETISLYDQTLQHILAPHIVPGNIKTWLNPALLGTTIDDTGAQQIRQIGRVMLTCEAIYTDVRTKLSLIINDAIDKSAGGTVDVILIAGISGGTGSGTIIDVSYMIHDIFRDFGKGNYTLAGYVYTPDAQFTVPTIASSPVIKANLKKNGYSALKEIDYFMNIEETHSLYTLKLMSLTVESTKNIFGSCTLVSGYNELGGLRPLDDIIECLTDQLLDMLTDIKINTNAGVQQMSSSIMSNDHAMLGTWFNQNPDRRLYHRYATYKYQVLGYNSIRIPRDEIFAYCVDKIYKGVLTEFKNFTKVNKQMLQTVYDAAHIAGPADAAVYAQNLGHINRELTLGGYSKGMVKNNTLIAYEDAVSAAQEEANKISGVFLTNLENDIFDKLKNQIDLIFNQNGPYMAMRAIQHKQKDLGDGNPNEPFRGVCEQCQDLSRAMNTKAGTCMHSGNPGEIQSLAANAIRMRGKAADMSAYVSECCNQAVEKYLDSQLYLGLSRVFANVAARMIDYNNELFEVYTSLLDEIQNILNRDGDYFAKGKHDHVGGVELYSVDLIQSGDEKAERLQKYLDGFISTVSVHELAANFIRAMRDNKEKWLAQKKEADFDVVHEVQTLMDNCLTQNEMIPTIIEKFVVVAYHPDELTPDELDEIWQDDAPNGRKMTALNAAGQYIFTTLKNGARAMANSAGTIPLGTFFSNYFVSALQDTPTLQTILDDLVFTELNTHIALSNSRNKFIYTQQYYDIPMYILRGMDEYNEEYVKHPSNGRHMDEKGQNWARFQNPYTIDSVSLDLQQKGKHQSEIDSYPDKKILDQVVTYTKSGLKSGYVESRAIAGGGSSLVLYDLSTLPNDVEKFKKDLKEEAINTFIEDKKMDLIEYMKNNGFALNPVEVFTGATDVDLGLFDFNNASADDKMTKYKDVPVPVEDVYKWLRKSIKYIDILEKDYNAFKEYEQIIAEAAVEVDTLYKYQKDIKTFALALRTGLVRRNASDQEKWEYMNGNDPVTVDFKLKNKFDRKFFLYHVFVEFQKMSKEILEEIHEQAENRISKGKLAEAAELTFMEEHIKEMLGDDYFGDRFKVREINQEARDMSNVENYQVTDERENIKNPYMVLKRFYTRLNASM